MTKLPSFQFYPGDWLKDTELRLCSIFARGLLVDLLCLMFEAKHRGTLSKPDGVTPLSDFQIVDAINGGSRDEKLSALQELIDNGVLKRNSQGIIYSSRLIRDESLRVLRKSVGSKGGSKTQANARASREAKGQAKSSSSSSSSPSTSSSDIETHTQAPPVVADATSVVTVGKSEPAPANFVAEQFVAWFGGSVHVTDKRRKALQQRWKDPWWRENWQTALERAAQSPFLRGETSDRGWKLTLDFFLKPDSVAKILEGTYDGSHQPNRSRLTPNQQREQNNAAAFAIFERAAALASGSDGGHFLGSSEAAGFLKKDH